MTIPSTTDNLIAELGRFAYNTEYSVDANMAMNAIETIRQLEKDAARYQGMRAVVMEEREGCTAKLYDEECDRLLSAWQAAQ